LYWCDGFGVGWEELVSEDVGLLVGMIDQGSVFGLEWGEGIVRVAFPHFCKVPDVIHVNGLVEAFVSPVVFCLL